jgi:anti-anti-sigma factor
VDESVVVTAAGRLGSAAAPELATVLNESSGAAQLILDLSAVDYLSSAGLHVIEDAAVQLQARQRSLRVRGAHGATKLSLELADRLPKSVVSATLPE